MSKPSARLWTCARCLRRLNVRGSRAPLLEPGTIGSNSNGGVRSFSIAPSLNQDKPPAPPKESVAEDAAKPQEEEGAMTRRLAEMVEETIDTGSKSDRKLMQDVGFSEELKKQLEERIAQSAFASQNQQAASQVKMPVLLDLDIIGFSKC